MQGIYGIKKGAYMIYFNRIGTFFLNSSFLKENLLSTFDAKCIKPVMHVLIDRPHNHDIF